MLTCNVEDVPNHSVADLLGVKIPVLDDGFIQLVDYMGDDTAIVQAARVSYGAGTKTIREDRGLIRYLMRNHHTSPFEMAEVKLLVRVPMDTWRQWIRHRTASVNEYSTRYSVAIDQCQRTDPHLWRLQAKDNKQGSSGVVATSAGDLLSAQENALQQMSRKVYEERLDQGVAREQARKDLPLSTYTEAYWKVDVHNLLHFLRLRLDSHAQAEIRAYAEAIAAVLGQWMPWTWEAFEDYRLNARSFSGPEHEMLFKLIEHLPRDVVRDMLEESNLSRHTKLSKREIREFRSKLGV